MGNKLARVFSVLKSDPLTLKSIEQSCYLVATSHPFQLINKKQPPNATNHVYPDYFIQRFDWALFGTDAAKHTCEKRHALVYCNEAGW